MKILLTNKNIWEYTHNLKKAFSDESLVLPAKISYAIQNNFFILLEKFELIEKNRVGIGKKYGVLSEDKTSYKIPEVST